MHETNMKVWMRTGPSKWVCIMPILCSASTAQTLAKLLTVEHAVSSGDLRFAASVHRPCSEGWRPDNRDAYFEQLTEGLGG